MSISALYPYYVETPDSTGGNDALQPVSPQGVMPLVETPHFLLLNASDTLVETDSLSENVRDELSSPDTVSAVVPAFEEVDSVLVADSVFSLSEPVDKQQYVPVVEVRRGIIGRHRQKDIPFSDGGFFALLLIELFLFLFFFCCYRKILSGQADEVSKSYSKKGLLRTFVGNVYHSFLLYTFLIEGTLGVVAFTSFGLPLPFVGGYLLNGLLMAFFALLYFLVQQGVFTFLARVFSFDARSQGWLGTHVTINLLLGICLFPFAFLAVYLPEISQGCLFISVGIYIVSRILFIVKGMKLFLRNFITLLYFILYLCALEIAPLLLGGKSCGLW
ncbi:MAG: DUF4271 domain-containing protein [Porphyromonadaceae bacterium]|nr:DUF4271 domain-containing protein [Porphyromonadaceae bacterium]